MVKLGSGCLQVGWCLWDFNNNGRLRFIQKLLHSRLNLNTFYPLMLCRIFFFISAAVDYGSQQEEEVKLIAFNDRTIACHRHLNCGFVSHCPIMQQCAWLGAHHHTSCRWGRHSLLGHYNSVNVNLIASARCFQELYLNANSHIHCRCTKYNVWPLDSAHLPL